MRIENELAQAGRQVSKPFYEAYFLLKNRLTQNGYAFTMSRFEGGNDHGPPHVMRVVEHLDSILGDNPVGRGILTPLELFLTMIAALYHDTGLLRGREEHAKSSADLLARDQNSYIFQPYEKDIVSAAIAAHSSSTSIDAPCAQFSDTEIIGNDRVRPRVVAALVRLADELDEDYRRADPNVAYGLDLPVKSRPFWLFCQRILGIRPDPQKKEILFNIKFDSDDAGLFVSTPTCPTAVVGWFRPACASYACTTAMVELFCMIERPI